MCVLCTLMPRCHASSQQVKCGTGTPPRANIELSCMPSRSASSCAAFWTSRSNAFRVSKMSRTAKRPDKHLKERLRPLVLASFNFDHRCRTSTGIECISTIQLRNQLNNVWVGSVHVLVTSYNQKAQAAANLLFHFYKPFGPILLTYLGPHASKWMDLSDTLLPKYLVRRLAIQTTGTLGCLQVGPTTGPTNLRTTKHMA